MRRRSVDVLVVGAGPSGLAAAAAARRIGAGEVLVVERDREPGGVPRHTHHTGFGLRDLRRLLSGPRYARAWLARAERAGAEVLTETSATGWCGPTSIRVTRPDGLWEIEAGAVVLAQGCRERPRPARLVPGDRPAGVFTTGSLQRAVFLAGLPVGRRAVIVGAEHVSFSALLTLRHAGARAVAIVTEHERDQTVLALRLATAARMRVPILTRARVSRIVGSRRVEAVEVADLDGGEPTTIPCDSVIFTGDWIPDHELARLGGLTIDPGTRGPRIDDAGRTSRPGVFAVGNLVHAAEAADVASRCASAAASAVRRYLAGEGWPSPVPVQVEPPLRWISPNAISPGASGVPHGTFLLRAERFAGPGTLEVRQGERRLREVRIGRLVPNRSLRLADDWIRTTDPDAGPVLVRFRAS